MDHYTLPHLTSKFSVCSCGHSGSTLKVMAQVDTKQVCCLIDSGATVFLINSRILSRTKFDTLEHESLPNALGANGTPLAVVGRIELSWKFWHKTEFYCYK